MTLPITFGPPKVIMPKASPWEKLPAAIAFGHGLSRTCTQNNASLASGFCDFSRTVENHAIPQPIDAGWFGDFFKVL